MFGKPWRVGSIFGVELRVDPSWLFIAFLISWSLFIRYDVLYPDLADGWAALLGVGSAALFFGSALAHELAHSLVARRRGLDVEGITLFLFGGATETSLDTEDPGDEFAVTVVGPLTSLAVAVVLGIGATVIGDPDRDASAGGVGYLAWLNVLLAAFNLVPGLPLDGGRLLRSGIWKATGDVVKATRIAARAGRAVGHGLLGVGVVSLFLGGFLGGLWLAAIGWFLSQAAQAEWTRFGLRRALRDVPVQAVMSSTLITVPADLPLDQAVQDYFLRHDHSGFPVVDGDRTIGLLTLRRVRRVPADERRARVVRDVMVPVDDLQSVAPTTPMTVVLERLADRDVNRVVVRTNGRVVGIVTPDDVTRWAQRREDVGLDI